MPTKRSESQKTIKEDVTLFIAVLSFFMSAWICYNDFTPRLKFFAPAHSVAAGYSGMDNAPCMGFRLAIANQSPRPAAIRTETLRVQLLVRGTWRDCELLTITPGARFVFDSPEEDLFLSGFSSTANYLIYESIAVTREQPYVRLVMVTCPLVSTKAQLEEVRFVKFFIKDYSGAEYSEVCELFTNARKP